MIPIDDSKATKPWRRDVTLQARPYGTKFSGAVAVSLLFLIRRPGTVKREMPIVKPDIDKLCRATLDGLVDAGALTDDSHIVDLTATKRYADGGLPPGCHVSIQRGL